MKIFPWISGVLDFNTIRKVVIFTSCTHYWQMCEYKPVLVKLPALDRKFTYSRIGASTHLYQYHQFNVVVSSCRHESFLGIQAFFWIYIKFPCSKCLIYDLSNAPETTQTCRRDCHCRFLLAVSSSFTFTMAQAFSQITGVCVCSHQLKNLQNQVNSICSPAVSRQNSLFISLSLPGMEYGTQIPELAEMQLSKSTWCRSALRLTQQALLCSYLYQLECTAAQMWLSLRSDPS